jgi:hypothetical protein
LSPVKGLPFCQAEFEADFPSPNLRGDFAQDIRKGGSAMRYLVYWAKFPFDTQFVLASANDLAKAGGINGFEANLAVNSGCYAFLGEVTGTPDSMGRCNEVEIKSLRALLDAWIKKGSPTLGFGTPKEKLPTGSDDGKEQQHTATSPHPQQLAAKKPNRECSRLYWICGPDDSQSLVVVSAQDVATADGLENFEARVADRSVWYAPLGELGVDESVPDDEDALKKYVVGELQKRPKVEWCRIIPGKAAPRRSQGPVK